MKTYERIKNEVLYECDRKINAYSDPSNKATKEYKEELSIYLLWLLKKKLWLIL